MIFPGASANTRRANRRISERAWNLGCIGAWHSLPLSFLMHAKQGLSMSPWTSFLFHSGPVRIPKAMDSIGYVWGCKKKNTVQCYDQVRSELAVNHRMTQHRSHWNCAASLAFVHVICVYLKECPSICNSLTPMKHVQALSSTGIVVYTSSKTLDGSRDALVSQDRKKHCCCNLGGGEQRNVKEL